MKPSSLVLVTCAAVALGAAQGRRAPACAPDNLGLTLPRGFCALRVIDSIGPARHLVALPNGDLLVAVRGNSGGVRLLRDTTGDGRADVVRAFGPAGGTGIAYREGFLYFATDDAVVRWAWQPGQLEPAGTPDTIVRELTNRRQHAAKGIALGADGALYVNIGAPANACQVEDRAVGSPGQDPCPLLDIAGGIWRFDAAHSGQRQTDGRRHATGLRNAMSLAVQPSTGALFAAQHGRDDLHRIWPALFTEQQSAEKPAEEVFLIEGGKDYGWPYCYYDPELKAKVLAPEYGGDGKQAGRCAAVGMPAVAFPAHWAPDAITFYGATQFPAKYRGGLFIAFHGSWNRAPMPQGGYNVVFVPFARGAPAGDWELFADGFAGADKTPGGALARPAGLAVGPDGSLYVSSDVKSGGVFRILYRP